MIRNIGNTDQTIRIILAVILLVMFSETDKSLLLNWLLLVGVFVLMATAVWRFCPLYKVLNITTYHPKARRKAVS